MFDLPIYLPDGLRLILIAVAAAIAGAVAGRLLMSLAKWLAKCNPQLSRHINLARLATPLYIVTPVLAVFIAIRAVAPEVMLTPVVSGTVKVASVALLYWLAMRIIDIVTVAVSRRYDITVADNLRARRIRTQIVVVKSIANFIVFLLALAAVFLMFDTLRGLGVSLLASAGVAGLAIGFAAQRLSAICWPASRSPSPSRSAWKTPWWWKTNGAGWRNHPDICHYPPVGLAPAGAADQLFHREALPELDPNLGQHHRHGGTVCRLHPAD